MTGLIDHLTELLDRTAATAAQVEVRSPELDLSWAAGLDGIDQPVSTASLFAVYCAGKPLTALAIATLVDDGLVRFDQPINQLLPDPRLITDDTTIDDLLSHNTGTWRHPAVAFVPLRRDVRREHIAEALARSTPPPTRTYSEFVGWELLSFVIEAVTEQPFAEYLWSAIIEPAGLSDHLEIRPERLIERRGDIRLNVSDVAGTPVPLVWERSIDNLGDPCASIGLYASMRGLVDLYVTLGRSLTAPGLVSSRSLHHLVEPAGEAAFDRVLDRPARHAHGFMVDLPHHGFPGLSERSFGHSGLSGMTFAGHDPDRQLSFAVHVNLSTNTDDGSASETPIAVQRRHDIVDQILREYGDRADGA